VSAIHTCDSANVLCFLLVRFEVCFRPATILARHIGIRSLVVACATAVAQVAVPFGNSFLTNLASACTQQDFFVGTIGAVVL
jgi:hypothetical protein